MGILGLILSIALIVAAGSANAQSFNCRYAKTADEVRICRDAGLRRLDDELGSTYSRILKENRGSGREIIRRGQTRWLARRRACGSDAGCLEAAYNRRLSELYEFAYQPD